jgi:hypothetical protein
VSYKGRRGRSALRGLSWPSFPLLWVLQVVGSNPAAPTNKVSNTFYRLAGRPSVDLPVLGPWTRCS